MKEDFNLDNILNKAMEKGKKVKVAISPNNTIKLKKIGDTIVVGVPKEMFEETVHKVDHKNKEYYSQIDTGLENIFANKSNQAPKISSIINDANNMKPDDFRKNIEEKQKESFDKTYKAKKGIKNKPKTRSGKRRVVIAGVLAAVSLLGYAGLKTASKDNDKENSSTFNTSYSQTNEENIEDSINRVRSDFAQIFIDKYNKQNGTNYKNAVMNTYYKNQDLTAEIKVKAENGETITLPINNDELEKLEINNDIADKAIKVSAAENVETEKSIKLRVKEYERASGEYYDELFEKTEAKNRVDIDEDVR